MHLKKTTLQTPPPSSTVLNIDGLVTSPTSSSKRRRAIQKRVVQIPIKETEGCRLKGESNTPPSDSWAWRKYGQKPIKGVTLEDPRTEDLSQEVRGFIFSKILN
ncbi:probable WRKY transcription factor 65 [Cajanus cajan]|uniref:probable WRKY transcription factor 65 n=1 Tax=Cajanus cajan TaxID=3821 RepID=UPI00098DB42D|nr:probable WRKY transcription factor 65 [Cajanus cajan]